MTSQLLLIEDDNFFQKFYATKLRDNDFTVDTASNGEDGIKLMNKKQYDLIMLDLVMPKMDGFDVLRKMSQDDNLKKIPVLVFSTLGQEQDVELAKQLGAVDYLNKSFYNFDDLLNKIKILTK